MLDRKTFNMSLSSHHKHNSDYCDFLSAAKTHHLADSSTNGDWRTLTLTLALHTMPFHTHGAVPSKVTRLCHRIQPRSIGIRRLEGFSSMGTPSLSDETWQSFSMISFASSRLRPASISGAMRSVSINKTWKNATLKCKSWPRYTWPRHLPLSGWGPQIHSWKR